MKTSFLTLDTPESLQIVRDIAAEVWPKTFAPILPPEGRVQPNKMLASLTRRPSR